MNRLGLSTGTIVAIRKTDEPRDGDVIWRVPKGRRLKMALTSRFGG